jgi:putative ABC transport system ATP-binding protein
MVLLDVKDASYKYKSTFNVLNGLNMQFESGKMYVILGESGAGKTTLLSLLAGLDVCHEGAIVYKGTDIKTINRNRYRAEEIGIIFQQFNLLYRFNALQNIMVAMKISNYKTENDKKYAQSLLTNLGITENMTRRKITELSGGEQHYIGRRTYRQFGCKKRKINNEYFSWPCPQ